MRLGLVSWSLFALSTIMGSMGSLSADESLDIRIPVVDMRDYYDEEKREVFLNTLYDAMSSVGFFAVRNSGVDSEAIRKAYAQAEKFFRQDSDYKTLSSNKELHGQRGFVAGEVAKGNKRKDNKEFYHIGREGEEPGNIWPSQKGFREDLVHLYEELESYVVPLQQAIIATINQHSSQTMDLDFLNERTKNGDSLLRALFYPALQTDETSIEDGPIYWAAPHTDIDLLTILPYATAKGLQVQVDDQWLNVVVPEDAFIVNIGDMLRNLSNGLFVSARHQVVAQETHKDRFSMVFFVHPRDSVPLDPVPACIELTGGIQTYAPGTRLEFLWERLLELNLAHQLLEPYSKTGHVERQLKYGKESPQVVDLLVRNGLASEELLKALETKGLSK